MSRQLTNDHPRAAGGEGLSTHGAPHGKYAISLGRSDVRHAGELVDNPISPTNGLRSLMHVLLPALYLIAYFFRWRCFICRDEMQACFCLLKLLVHVRW